MKRDASLKEEQRQARRAMPYPQLDSPSAQSSRRYALLKEKVGEKVDPKGTPRKRIQPKTSKVKEGERVYYSDGKNAMGSSSSGSSRNWGIREGERDLSSEGGNAVASSSSSSSRSWRVISEPEEQKGTASQQAGSSGSSNNPIVVLDDSEEELEGGEDDNEAENDMSQ
jgi:hypothetical protein